MRLEVLCQVARLVWSLLLRFLHEMLYLVGRLRSDVSGVQVYPYWWRCVVGSLVLRKKWSKSGGRGQRGQALVETKSAAVSVECLFASSWVRRKWRR